VKKRQTAKKNKVRSFKGSYILLAAVLVMAGFFVFKLINLGSDIRQSEKQLEEVSMQVESQQEENAKLQAVIDGDKGEYMEKIAREDLGYGKIGEKFFYNVTPGAND